MRLWVVAIMYTCAFLGAMATFWAFVSFGVMDLLSGRIDSMFVLLMIPTMASLCAFSVIYGLASGRALKWQYWLFAPLGMALLSGIMPMVVMQGYTTAYEGFVAAVLLVFLIGFLACLRRDGVAAPAQQAS